MRKFKFLAMFLLVLTLVFTAVACQDGKTIEKIEVKDGTIATVVEKDGVLKTDKLEIIVYYSDGTTETVKKADGITVGEFSTAQVGKFDLKITYKNVTVNYPITVTEPAGPGPDNPDNPEDLRIVGVTLPQFITAHNTAIAEKQVTDSNPNAKRSEFYDRNDGFYVGDDNPFEFKPEVMVLEEGYSVPVDYSKIDAELTLEIKNDDTYDKVENIDQYVEVIEYGKYQFLEAAVGKTIRFTVRPFIKGDPDSGNQSVNFEFKIVDGWNVYTAKDLCMIEYDRLSFEADNEEHGTADRQWKQFKTANGYDVNKKVAAVILHNDISITKEDIPASFLYKESDVNPSDGDYNRGTQDNPGVSVVNSLRDGCEIYERYVSPGEKFEIIGNYFNLDASAMPLVVRERDKGVTPVGQVVSHATLIKITGKNKENTDNIAYSTMKNLYLIGNSNRSDENGGVLSGGLIFYKVQDVDFEIKNSIAIKWFITFFPESWNGSITKHAIKDCKAYDNYNSFMYVWGGEPYANQNFFTVDHTEMVGAGGPVMICDEADYQEAQGSRFPANVKVSTDCHLESFVTGTEGWFALVKAHELAGDVKGINTAFTQFGRTFLKDGKFNFIAVFKANTGAAAPEYAKIKGYLGIGDNTPLDFGQGPSLSSMIVKGLLENAQLAQGGAPIFQSAQGGVAYFDGTKFMGVDPSTQTPTQIVDSGNDLFKGDYLNIYVAAQKQSGHLGAVMGYYPAE